MRCQPATPITLPHAAPHTRCISTIVVLDMKSTPIIEHRMSHARDFTEALFIQMIMGDDRAVQATYVAGKLLYEKTGQNAF